MSDHVLVEDVQVGWEKKDQDRQSVQRILDMSEKVLQAQNKWRGAGKFLLRKLSDVSQQHTTSKNSSSILSIIFFGIRMFSF